MCLVALTGNKASAQVAKDSKDVDLGNDISLTINASTFGPALAGATNLS